MANSRDYGTFTKAALRLLRPSVESMGYRHLENTCFVRERSGWVEGFFLQETHHGGGFFWVNIGIHIPKLNDLWQKDTNPFGLTIGARLDTRGVDRGAAFYPSENAAELAASLEQVARDLQMAELWFARFKSMSDVANEYKLSNNVDAVDDGGHLSTIANINYGFLLLLAGQDAGAKAWLEVAHRQCLAIVSENEAGFKRRKPGKEALVYHGLDMARLRAVEAALRGWP